MKRLAIFHNNKTWPVKCVVMDHSTLSVVMPHSKETTPVKAQTVGSLNTEECISDTVMIQTAARLSINSVLSTNYFIG